MFGIVIATFGAPVLIGFVTGQGYGIKTVFAIGMVFAVVSFISLTMLEKNLKNKCSRKNKAVEICE